MRAHAALPVLAEVWEVSVFEEEGRGEGLTVVGDLLVVLDRLEERKVNSRS